MHTWGWVLWGHASDKVFNALKLLLKCKQTKYNGKRENTEQSLLGALSGTWSWVGVWIEC